MFNESFSFTFLQIFYNYVLRFLVIIFLIVIYV